MRIRADFDKRELVQTNEVPWTPSPMPGVERRMLDRVGDEVARATSIVRYAPGSRFTPHTHGGGEELLVLEGIFEDEHGAFGPGSYLRNPPTSRHTPGSEPGCVILVKLWQFDPDDRRSVRVDTQHTEPVSEGELMYIPLYDDPRERVRIELWHPGRDASLGCAGGTEIYVLDGRLDCVDTEESFCLESGAWLRLPMNSQARAVAGDDGARIWIKTGHVSLFPFT